jgi:hypothetical protein
VTSSSQDVVVDISDCLEWRLVGLVMKLLEVHVMCVAPVVSAGCCELSCVASQCFCWVFLARGLGQGCWISRLGLNYEDRTVFVDRWHTLLLKKDYTLLVVEVELEVAFGSDACRFACIAGGITET